MLCYICVIYVILTRSCSC